MSTRWIAMLMWPAVLSVACQADGQMAVEWWGQADYCRHKKMTLQLSHYGKEGMTNPKMGRKPIEGIHALTFDLSGIRKSAKIHHASLRIRAPQERIRTDKRAYMNIGSGHWYHDPLRLYAEIRPWKPIEIYAAAPSSTKAVYDKTSRLKLEPPQFRSFDATAAVRAWVSGKAPNRGFVVRQLDLWDWAPSQTVLEVRYAGKPTQVPPQAKDICVIHRKGQTFITWTEIDKIITKDKILWKEFEDTFKKVAPRQGRWYRVYRHDKPITAANLHRAERIDEIWPLSGYDFRLHEHLTRGEDWMGLNPASEVTRYVIDAPPAGVLKPNGTFGKQKFPQWQGKPLPLHTGLYVHRPAKAGKFYYAVTACKGGVENTRDIQAGVNALAQPVDETVGDGEPILYRVLQQWGWKATDKVRETQFFVYWAAPPYANQPRRPVHLMVGLHGPNPPGKLIVQYNIGDMYGSDLLRGTHANSWKSDTRIVAIADDAAFGSRQYWSSWNTLMSREQAKQFPYAGRIIEKFTPMFKTLTKRAAATLPSK